MPCGPLRLRSAINSFTNAAEELCVTSGAVSQQVRQLEAWFNLRLFERIPGGLRPTSAAQTLHPVVADAFSSIREACGQLMGRTSAVATLGLAHVGGALVTAPVDSLPAAVSGSAAAGGNRLYAP